MANRAVINGREEGGGGGGGGQADEDSVLRLRWNSHVESLQQLFESLLEQQLFVDVTLACEGGSLKAHRVMLSACSSYFRRVLHEAGTKNPVIIMRDVPRSEMDHILQFIYRGEIHVPEANLPSLLRTARLLEIRGLSDDLEKPASEAKKQEAQTDSRKRRNSNSVTPNGPSSNHQQLNGKAKKPAQIIEPIHEEMDSETEMSQHIQNGNGHHNHTAKMEAERRASPPTPLDLSNGDICASDEENEIPDPLDTSAEKKTTSPVPVLVKCETPATAEEDDEEEDDTSSSTAEQYPFSMLAETDQSGSGAVVVQAVCPFCFKDCKRTAELRAHIRAHTGEKPFRCDICSAPFARSAHLKRHRRVHTGERPFECHRCQKTFSRQDKLKLHMDRHRLRDTGGKMIVGRPKKLAPKKNETESPAGTSNVSSSASTAVEMAGMGQFAFPGAPARPGPASSPSERSTASSSSSSPSLSFGDMNYFSLLSLSQRGLTISSTSQGSNDMPSPTVPNLLSPQALHELQLFRQSSPRGRPPSAHQQQRATRAAMAAAMAMNHHRGRSAAESASETLLNFAQRVGETPPPSASSS